MLHESLSQKLKPLSAPEEEKGEQLDQVADEPV